MRACPLPSRVFLAFWVTLQSHSAKFVCCCFSSATWVCPELSRGPFVNPEFNLPTYQYWMLYD